MNAHYLFLLLLPVMLAAVIVSLLVADLLNITIDTLILRRKRKEA